MKNTDQQGISGFDNLSDVDPAVESLLDQGQCHNIETHLLRNLRSHQNKERERTKKCLVNRIKVYLLVDLYKRLEILAKKEGVPVSQLVTFLLYGPLHQFETHMISLWATRCPHAAENSRGISFSIDMGRRFSENV